MNTRTIIASTVCLLMAASAAHADKTEKLIQLDKEWGESQGPDALEGLIADNVVTLGPDGLVDKAQMLEAAASDDAPTGPYTAGDYDVRFLSKHIAVMVHSAGEPDPHWSMHVWQKMDDKWQVVANATVPTEE